MPHITFNLPESDSDSGIGPTTLKCLCRTLDKNEEATINLALALLARVAMPHYDTEDDGPLSAEQREAIQNQAGTGHMIIKKSLFKP